MTFRSNHWSCTKFANLVRGAKKPRWGTSEEWAEWKSTTKASSRVRFWLAEEGLTILQDIVYWPYDVWSNIQAYINNRFLYKTHTLDTGLEKGLWHEFDDRLIHGVFEELVKFVELEKASWGNKSGIDCLIWEIGLIEDDEYMGYSSDIPCPVELRPETYGQPTHQSIRAMETLELYCWWKYIRPNRPDPMDASGYTEYYDAEFKNGRSLLFSTHNDSIESDIDVLWRDASMSLNHAYEERYDDEDTEMLVRLINLRHALWT